MRSLHVFKIPIPYWGSLGETDAVPRERSKERRGKSTFLFQHPVLKSYPSNTGLAGGDDDGVKSQSHVPVFEAPWPVAHQAPLSMGFPRQEHWSGLPFSEPGNLPNSGIKPMSPDHLLDYRQVLHGFMELLVKHKLPDIWSFVNTIICHYY